MQAYFPSIFFGSIISIMAVSMLLNARKKGRQFDNDESIDDNECQFLQRQTRRRIKTSLVLLVVGIGIPTLDIVADFRLHPAFKDSIIWSLYLPFSMLVGLMLAIIWLVLLALQDLFSTRNFRAKTFSEIKSLKIQQRALEEEARRLVEEHKKKKQADPSRNGTSNPE